MMDGATIECGDSVVGARRLTPEGTAQIRCPAPVRRATAEDAPHMMAIAQRAYTDRPIDWSAVYGWLVGFLGHPMVFGAISGEAASISALSEWIPIIGAPPRRQVQLSYLAGIAHVWDAVRCLKLTADWSRAVRAERFVIDAETGVDLGPLVKRVGLPVVALHGYSVRMV